MPSLTRRRKIAARRTSRRVVARKPQPTTVAQAKQEIKDEINPIVNAAARTLGGATSAFMGLGPGIGSSLADSAHRMFKSITGYGEYKVNSNSLMTNNGTPIFKPADRITRIRHREFIRDIITAGPNFTIALRLAINPSNPSLFPWLSQIAPNYQQFRFRGLIFSFESKSGTAIASTNTSLGTVVLSTLYNAYEKIPTNKQAMEALEFTTSCVPSTNMIHPIECAPREQVLNHLYVSQDPQSDARFSTLGTFLCATVGQQAAANLGELWVSYDVELLKPHAQRPQVDIHLQSEASTLTSLKWFGDKPKILEDNIGINIDAPGSIVSFPDSFYGEVEVNVAMDQGVSTSAFAFPTITPIGNASLVLAYANNTMGYVAPTCSATSSAVFSFALKLNGGGSFSILGGTPLSSVTTCDYYISQL